MDSRNDRGVSPTWTRRRRPLSYRVEAQQDFIQGLRLSWVSVTQVTIGAGRCADSTGRQLVRSASTLTVDITASGAGGLDTGSEANSTWYAVYLIAGPTGIAGMLSTSATTPTKPAGYPFARRVGWVKNDGSSDLAPFQQSGGDRNRIYDWNIDKNSLLVLSSGAASTYTSVDCSAYIPSTSINAYCLVLATAGSNWVFVRPSTLSNATGAVILCRNDASRNQTTWIRCPGQALDYHRGTDSSSRINIYILGYEDLL